MQGLRRNEENYGNNRSLHQYHVGVTNERGDWYCPIRFSLEVLNRKAAFEVRYVIKRTES